MTSSLPMPFNLVCPLCRKPGAEGNLIVSVLSPRQDSRGAVNADQCPLCGTDYPRIEGIPCVPPDLDGFRKAQGATLGSHWIYEDRESAAAACRIAADLDSGSDTYHEVSNLACHALAHFPEGAGALAAELKENRILISTLVDWLSRTDRPAATRSPCALEVGCGPGAFLHALAPLFSAGALGLDLRIGALRLAQRVLTHGEAFLSYRSEGRRFEPVRISAPQAPQSNAGRIFLVQGDLLAPPLEAEAFPLVAAVSLLDTVSDPLFAFGQLDALLAPGGLLLLGTPYSWDPRATSPREWWSQMDSTGTGTVRALLAGRHPVLPYLRYDILQEADHLIWSVPCHDRLVFRFFLDVVLARKINH
jgi:SAM-dependent methyltransferase